MVLDCARSEKMIIDMMKGNRFTRRSARLPFLEHLRTEGKTWTNYHSISSTTTPNFASMFTGLFPLQHGIKEHSRYRLLDDVPTVAEILSDAGYHTYAEVSGPLIPETDLKRGFQHYRWRDKNEYLHQGFLQHLNNLFARLEEPWFLVLHFWEAHEPYQNPEPFNTDEYGLTTYDRALSFIDHFMHYFFMNHDLRNTSVIYTSDHGERLAQDYLLNANLGGEEFRVWELLREFQASNSGTFPYSKWFDFLQQELGEIKARIYAHNVVGHGFHLTEDLIRVPLIIKDKDFCEAGAVCDELRQQTELFPTLLDLAGISHHPEYPVQGKSLFESDKKEMIYIEANGSGGKKFSSQCYLRGAKDNRWKYWRVETDGVIHQELWDLQKDPRETKNVIEEYPGIAMRFDEFVSQNTLNDRSKMVDIGTDEAEIIEEHLRELGYIE